MCTQEAGRQTPAQQVLFYSWWVIPALHLLNLLPWSVCPEFSPTPRPLPPSHFSCLSLCLSGFAVQLCFLPSRATEMCIAVSFHVHSQNTDAKSKHFYGVFFWQHSLACVKKHGIIQHKVLQIISKDRSNSIKHHSEKPSVCH